MESDTQYNSFYLIFLIYKIKNVFVIEEPPSLMSACFNYKLQV